MSHQWLIQKYLNLFSGQLQQFHKSRDGLWNCRCPYCGDSKKSKTKTRGYFFWNGDVLVYKCHNCGISTTFQSVLKDYDHTLFKEMMLEMFGSKSDNEPIIKTDTKKIKNRLSGKLVGIKPVSGGLFEEYLTNRHIPQEKQSLFLEIESLSNFAKLFEQYKDKKFPDVKCIGIPFHIDDKISFVQCRTIEECGMRYITFEVDGGPKIFGYNNIDKSKTASVLEGPFDSTFVYNAVANAGAADHSNTDFLIQQGCDLRFIFDRDYETNPQVRKQLDERISQGYKVVIYDKNFQYKDINDAIIGGWDIGLLNSYLDKRTFKGLKAKIELSRIAR